MVSEAWGYLKDGFQVNSVPGLTAMDHSLTLIEMERTLSQKCIDRSISILLFATVCLDCYIAFGSSANISWYDLVALIVLYSLMLYLAATLWLGKKSGISFARVFYGAQVPTIVVFGSFAYRFDGGLRLAFGWLGSSFRFLFLILHAQFSIEKIPLDSEASAFGLMINFAALALAIYYSRRHARATQSGYSPTFH
jgi:hypothetical protein